MAILLEKIEAGDTKLGTEAFFEIAVKETLAQLGMDSTTHRAGTFRG